MLYPGPLTDKMSSSNSPIGCAMNPKFTIEFRYPPFKYGIDKLGSVKLETIYSFVQNKSTLKVRLC